LPGFRKVEIERAAKARSANRPQRHGLAEGKPSSPTDRRARPNLTTKRLDQPGTIDIKIGLVPRPKA
jgi:hypothetical protein